MRDADALVWDLRDGWGGAQPDYLDLFNSRAPTMQVTDRNGDTGMVDVKWRKPVAMLINGGTRSGKEVLAYGFKEYRLGELVGVRTEGAVLAATAFLIGDSGLLLLAAKTSVWMGSAWRGSASHRLSKSRSIFALLRAAIRSSTALCRSSPAARKCAAAADVLGWSAERTAVVDLTRSSRRWPWPPQCLCVGGP